MLVLQNFGHLCVLTTGIFLCRFDGDPNLDIVQPAIRGTRTVLEAAAKQKQHGLKRVVVTSSVCGEANLIVLFMLIFQQCILFASWSLHGQGQLIAGSIATHNCLTQLRSCCGSCRLLLLMELTVCSNP